jgi:DNA polymerase-3 subunit gamma/tau
MSYLVLARKWRPRSFADLAGQEHVVQTLRNAISLGRVAHAFLFSGARGVGKTTIARIMAKALNCLEREGASADPCLQCAACREIAEGRDPDVREIDGATHNKVENVRELQETLAYMPARDRHKVIIVDEAHMLTDNAWNALLKTLEEPPPHVKFIFATTEVHEFPITILSRCQRYDFRLLPAARIRERVGHILRAEGIGYDDAAVSLVTREAAGSMRDALSLLDQLIAGVSGTITGAAAARLLGVADRQVLYDLVRAVLTGDGAGALAVVASIAREGYDLPNVALHVHAVLRDLVVARVVPDPAELLDLADEERAEVLALALLAQPADLERLFVAWGRTAEEVSRAREARWALEMACVRLAHRPPLLPADELVARLAELERRLSSSGGAATDPSRAPARGPGAGPAGASPAPGALPARAPSPLGGGPVGGAPGAGTTTGSRFTITRPGGDGGPRAALSEPGPVASRGAAAAVASLRATVAVPAEARFTAVAARAAEAPAASPPAAAPAPEPPAPTVDTSGAAAALGFWRQVVAAVEGSLAPVLKGAVPLEVTPERVRLAVDERDSFFKRKLSTPETQAVVADAAGRVFGARPVVELLLGVLPEGAPSIQRTEEDARKVERDAREAHARHDPMVRAVCELLGGEVFRVRLPGDPL